jgi:hypothetical protein
MTTLTKSRKTKGTVISRTLPNGKQLKILATDGRIEQALHRWPSGSWTPIDPRILAFTLPRLVSEYSLIIPT